MDTIRFEIYAYEITAITVARMWVGADSPGSTRKSRSDKDHRPPYMMPLATASATGPIPIFAPKTKTV